MISPDRTVVLPTEPGASWAFAYPPKHPDDALDYALDARAWLAANGLTLLTCSILASPALVVGAPSYLLDETGTVRVGVAMELSRGTGGEAESVEFRLSLTNGTSARTLEVVVVLPVVPAPAGLVPADQDLSNALTVNGVAITVGGQPIPV